MAASSHVKAMASVGASTTVQHDRAARLHRALFAQVTQRKTNSRTPIVKGAQQDDRQQRESDGQRVLVRAE